MMLAKDAVLSLFQERYYDAIDSSDMAAAVTALHEDVEFNHVQVWQRTDLELGATAIHGRAAVHAFLDGARAKLAEAGIRHRIDDLVVEGDRGAFTAAVSDEHGEAAPFLVWFELRDGLVSRYIVRPI
jgi:hypothetical protein